MSIGIDSGVGVHQLNSSYRAAQRSVSRVSSGQKGGSPALAGPAVKVSIDIALLRKSREMNAGLATDLIASLPPLGK